MVSTGSVTRRWDLVGLSVPLLRSHVTRGVGLGSLMLKTPGVTVLFLLHVDSEVEPLAPSPAHLTAYCHERSVLNICMGILEGGGK